MLFLRLFLPKMLFNPVLSSEPGCSSAGSLPRHPRHTPPALGVQGASTSEPRSPAASTKISSSYADEETSKPGIT